MLFVEFNDVDYIFVEPNGNESENSLVATKS